MSLSGLSSRAGSRATASRLGSARHFHEPEKQARLGSLEAREPLRAEPSRSELEPAREPRAIFPTLTSGKSFAQVPHHQLIKTHLSF